MSKQKFLLLLIPVFLLVAVIAQAQGIQVPTSGETGLPDGSVSGVLNTVLNWLLMIFVIIATISFVITGLQFIFSFGGASGSEAQAKKNFTYTIIAIFIVGGSLIILKTIIGLLGPVSSGSAGGGNNTSNNNFTNWAQDARNLHNAENRYNNTQNSAQQARNMENQANLQNNNNPPSPGQTNWAQDARNLHTAEEGGVVGSDGLHQSDMPQNNF